MNQKRKLNLIKRRRANRVRARIRGVSVSPRLSVFRSNKYISAQLIDDASGKTLASVNSRSLKEKSKKSELAKKVGLLIAEKAKKLKIERAVLDRGRYLYHGRVKALAEGAREGGLNL
jgi:large subunit ribosomal protein L18